MSRLRTRLRQGRDPERGSALVEVFVLGLLLLLPVVYLMLTVFAVQRAAYGVTAAAREAGRVFTVRGDTGAADAAARVALGDQGVPPGDASVSICAGDPGCFAPGARVEVVVSTRVALPLVPQIVADGVNAAVPVSATHVATVDQYRVLP